MSSQAETKLRERLQKIQEAFKLEDSLQPIVCPHCYQSEVSNGHARSCLRRKLKTLITKKVG